MSDPATNPAHELDDAPQDPAVREPRARLSHLAPLVRVLAGRRGHASVSWFASGFVHTLAVERRDVEPDGLSWDVAPEVDAALLLSLFAAYLDGRDDDEQTTR